MQQFHDVWVVIDDKTHRQVADFNNPIDADKFAQKYNDALTMEQIIAGYFYSVTRYWVM